MAICVASLCHCQRCGTSGVGDREAALDRARVKAELERIRMAEKAALSHLGPQRKNFGYPA